MAEQNGCFILPLASELMQGACVCVYDNMDRIWVKIDKIKQAVAV